ncbi:MAG: DNA sulfur modification protein DndB [Chloroflexi bacterium]|nr:DNA sulfur modification protein DndB [Chloroflexota bacterium]
MATGNAKSTTREFPTLQEAFNAAAEAAMMNFGRPVTGIMYTQAGRRFVSTSLPVRMLLTLAKRDSTGKKDDPSLHRNRPLDQSHVREIVAYLCSEQRYLMPPIMLNAAQPLQVFAYQNTGATRPCVFVLPSEEYLFVTDGQHRLEALRQALAQRPELERDAVGVTIIEEADLDQVHQDFYDAAQVMPLAKALLVEYDGREPINWLTRETSNEAAIFKGRVERIGTVGKNSLMLFTTNQVKQGILQLVVGDWSLYGEAMLKQAEQIVTPAKELWKERIVRFFDAFAQANEQWRKVAERPLESGLATDIPGMRQDFLHFIGGGLLVLCGVGHGILELDANTDGSLTSRQKALVQQLAELDWSRRDTMWQGSLVGPQGNVTPQKNNIVLAVAKAKKVLGLAISAKEAGTLERVASGGLVPSVS